MDPTFNLASNISINHDVLTEFSTNNNKDCRKDFSVNYT